MVASAYHVISKEVKNHIMIHNWIFRHTCCINDPHCQISESIIFWCKHCILISDTLVGSFQDVLFLLLAVILSGLQEGIKIELLKKEHRRICDRVITFLTARSTFYVNFCCFHHFTPPPPPPSSSQVMCLLNSSYKDT